MRMLLGKGGGLLAWGDSFPRIDGSSGGCGFSIVGRYPMGPWIWRVACRSPIFYTPAGVLTVDDERSDLVELQW